jgi:DUF917 family protein
MKAPIAQAGEEAASPPGCAFIFCAPKGGGLTNSTIQKTHKDLATIAPAEAGGIGSTVPVVWKEETVVFVRDRARVERAFAEALIAYMEGYILARAPPPSGFSMSKSKNSSLLRGAGAHF